MVKLRLTRRGRKGHAAYHVIAIDSHKARDSKALEVLGHYLPHEKSWNIKIDRVQYWLEIGAKPSKTVANLLAKENVIKKENLDMKTFKAEPGEKAKERAANKQEKAEASSVQKEQNKVS